jgi:hypothetical protein
MSAASPPILILRNFKHKTIMRNQIASFFRNKVKRFEVNSKG